MKSVEIEVPNGYIIDEEKSTFAKIIFKEVEKPIIERVKTFADVCKILGKKESEFEPTKFEDASDAAMRKLKAIVKVFNEGHVLDWSNSNEWKYIPVFHLVNGRQVLDYVNDWCSSATVPAPLYYKSEELAEYAANQFLDIYTTAYQL